MSHLEFYQEQEWQDMESFWADMYYLAQPEKESNIRPLSSTEILKQYGTKVKRLREKNLKPSNGSCGEGLSSETIMKLAKVRLLQLKTQKIDILSHVKSYFGTRQSGLITEVSKDLEIALLIQAAGEKVANQQMVYAKKLLTLCGPSASMTGTPVQRVAYYFAEALQDRIDQEWGMMSSDSPAGKNREKMDAGYLDRELVNPEMTASQHEQPFCLVTQFAATESILENVASENRVHLIDFSLDNGSQWTLIMQAFAARTECPLKLLKITAVGTCKSVMEETGKWLSSFAENIHLPFSFNIVVSDLKNLKEDHFEIEGDEVVAVCSSFRLWTLLAWPNHLKALIGVIKSLKPCVMLIRELEVNTATSIFLERFNELLFFSSALFDCVKACCEHHIQYRKQAEACLREMIHNTVTAEGAERYQRQEKIAFWRALFASFGIVEADLSSLSLCQGSLLLRRSDRLSSCCLAMDGNCLIMGWKGTPLESFSAWKFH